MKLSKLITFLTLICMFISLSGISYAQTYYPPLPEIYAVHEDGSVVVAAYRTTEDGLVKLSKSEYKKFINESKAIENQKSISITEQAMDAQNNNIVVPFAFEPYTDYVYEESGIINPVYKYSERRRISQVKYNNTQNLMSHTFLFIAK